jgi:cytochrome c-type biogenesis protein CcmH
MLGRTEVSLGHLPEAASAWRRALATRFDPTLAAETAEVITDSEGHVTPEAAALFKRALAEAPADVPWRKAAEKRVSEAGGS